MIDRSRPLAIFFLAKVAQPFVIRNMNQRKMFVHFRHVSTRTIDIDGASGPQKAFEEKCFYRSLKIIAKYSRYTGVTMDFLTYTP